MPVDRVEGHWGGPGRHPVTCPVAQYSKYIDIEGLIATASVWKKSSVS